MSEHQAAISWKRTSPDFLKGKYSREHAWTFDGGLTMPASPSPSVVPVPYSNPAHIDPDDAALDAERFGDWLRAAKSGFQVDSYRDEAIGAMTKNPAGVAWISLVRLNPTIVYSGEKLPARADEERLHHLAHEQCFIANSIKTEVRVESKPTE